MNGYRISAVICAALVILLAVGCSIGEPAPTPMPVPSPTFTENPNNTTYNNAQFGLRASLPGKGWKQVENYNEGEEEGEQWLRSDGLIFRVIVQKSMSQSQPRDDAITIDTAAKVLSLNYKPGVSVEKARYSGYDAACRIEGTWKNSRTYLSEEATLSGVKGLEDPDLRFHVIEYCVLTKRGLYDISGGLPDSMWNAETEKTVKEMLNSVQIRPVPNSGAGGTPSMPSPTVGK